MDRFELVLSFLNSEFFIALVTLLVGATAFILYIKQRRDNKSDSALLILQEIRYAEQVFRMSTQAGTMNFPIYEKLLPTNNWNRNIHLFLNELEETELDLISRFYSKASYIDLLVNKISDFKNQQINPTPVLREPPRIIINQTPVQNQTNITAVPVMFDPMENTHNLLRIVSSEMADIYNTPTGEKLKRLARRKSLFTFS
jgi:hypothetical protein